ncbi:MAG: PAS domain-containing protein [Bacteroidota bacterium]
MIYTSTNNVEEVAQLLLNIGDSLVEVSRESLVTGIWYRKNSSMALAGEFYLGKNIGTAYTGEIVGQCATAIKTVFATRKNVFFEYKAFKGDTPVTYVIRVLACHPDSNYLFLLVELHDSATTITTVEDKWRLALDASGVGMWDVNMETGIIAFSDKWHELFGYTAREIKTLQDWIEKVHPEDLPEAKKSIDKYLSGDAPVYSAELRYKCKSGEYKWVLSQGVVLTYKTDGAPARVVGTHKDINETKLAEDALRTNIETFSNSFNFSGIGKALVAPGGKWVAVNNVVCALTEYTKEELLQLHYNDITHPEDVDKDLSYIGKLINKELSSYTIEQRYISKNRNVVIALLTVTLVRDKQDKPAYFICDIVDITQNKKLAEEVNRKNLELETTSRNLVSKIRQLEDLNNVIAHNFRGPVGNIKLVSDDMMERMEAEKTGDKDFQGIFSFDDGISIIQESSTSLLANLEMLVELARINTNTDIAYDNCDVAKTVAEVEKQLHGTIFQTNAMVILNLEVKSIWYPKYYLESILYNLLSNALKYCKPGKSPVILVKTATNEQGKVELSVKDNGMGIDMDRYHNDVFKLNRVFHKGYNSKGIGLFLTRTQIESLGGTITVTSKPEKGCEFTVRF